MNLIERVRGDRVDRMLQEASRAYAQSMGSVSAMLAREDVGWTGFGDQDRGVVPLAVIKDHARRARHLIAYNPLVKRGIAIRNAYMWADLPEVVSGSVDDAVSNSLLSLTALSRNESSLCSDGIVLFLVDPSRKIVRPVPVSRIRGVARDRDAAEEGDVYAFLVDPVPPSTELSVDIPEPEWYVVHGKHFVPVQDSAGHRTNRQWAAVYMAPNRQVGEVWGKPDLMGAVYWARAYKEYLEASYTMARALARIAFKVTSTTSGQQKAVMQQMSGAQGVGGTASLAPGQEFTAVSKAGAGIDFAAGTPLAAMVSASLDVPLSVLLTDGSAGGRQGAETALEEPTYKALEMRRQIHLDFVRRVLAALGSTATVALTPLSSELIQRWAQAIALGTQNGYLHQIEARRLYLDRFRPVNALPEDDLPEIPEAASDGVGALSDGTNANRDEDGGETVA